jgi:hypothetical protein
MIGTIVGAVMSVMLAACFPQDRVLFLGALALWGGASALAGTLLRNFAGYSAALAGYTAAIVAGDLLGATGGVNADAAFLLAVSRGSEICIGIVCAGVILAGTDFGGAQRRFAILFAVLAAEISGRFADTLALAGPDFPDTQPVRVEFVRRVIALDPVIEEAFGESSQLRHHKSALLASVSGLFAALAGWRTVAVCLAQLPDDQARQEADAVLQNLPGELRSAPVQGAPTRWITDPVGLRRISEAAVHRLIACRLRRRRCDCLPIRRRRFWLASSVRSTGWRCSLTTRPDPFLTAGAFGWEYQIGCRLSSTRRARLSPLVPSLCFGSPQHGLMVLQPLLLGPSASSCTPREPINPMSPR